jgi:hypothetical protein
MGNRYKDFDKLVERYGFDRKICPNVSKHWGNDIPSDMLFDMWTQYLIRSKANKHFDKSFKDMNSWGPVECLEFYSTRLLGANGDIQPSYRLAEDDPTIDEVIGKYSHAAREVLAYRWNHGYALTTYEIRIQTSMGRKAKVDGKSCFDEIRKLEKLLEEKDALVSGKEELCSNPRIDKRLRAMLKNMDVSIVDVMDDDDNGD